MPWHHDAGGNSNDQPAQARGSRFRYRGGLSPHGEYHHHEKGNTMSTDVVQYPHEVDNPAWPVVREWHLSETRRVLIVHDDNPSCPLHDEEGASIAWNGKGNRPWWDKDGDTAWDKPDGHAFPFRYYDTRNGSRFDVLDDDDFDDDDQPTGWVVMDDDWTDPRGAADGFMGTMSLWAEGEAYGWVTQTRHHYTSTTSERELDDWQTDDSCWGYFGDTVLEAVRDEVEGMEGVTA